MRIKYICVRTCSQGGRVGCLVDGQHYGLFYCQLHGLPVRVQPWTKEECWEAGSSGLSCSTLPSCLRLLAILLTGLGWTAEERTGVEVEGSKQVEKCQELRPLQIKGPLSKASFSLFVKLLDSQPGASPLRKLRKRAEAQILLGPSLQA